MNVALLVDGVEAFGPFPALYLMQALDRPARLEVELAPALTREAATDPPLRIGARVVVRSGPETIFHGLLERCGERVSALDGRSRWLVAYDDYHRLRDTSALGPWYQTTDAEAAERIASALELVSSVESTPQIHAVIEPRGDPLTFLRGRARQCGYELAVWDGRLHFARSIAAEGLTVAIRREEILRLELEERRSKRTTRRGGRIELCGDWRWKPLLPLRLEGLDVDSGGRYRSVRALHALNRSGFRTQIELAADGLDYFQDSESEIVDLHQ